MWVGWENTEEAKGSLNWEAGLNHFGHGSRQTDRPRFSHILGKTGCECGFYSKMGGGKGPSFSLLLTQDEFWFPDSLFRDVKFPVGLVSQNKCTYFIFLKYFYRKFCFWKYNVSSVYFSFFFHLFPYSWHVWLSPVLSLIPKRGRIRWPPLAFPFSPLYQIKIRQGERKGNRRRQAKKTEGDENWFGIFHESKQNS